MQFVDEFNKRNISTGGIRTGAVGVIVPQPLPRPMTQKLKKIPIRYFIFLWKILGFARPATSTIVACCSEGQLIKKTTYIRQTSEVFCAKKNAKIPKK